MNFKEEYKSGLDKIRFDENFNEKTMELIREKTTGKTVRNSKPLRVIIAAAAVFALFSITVFAASVLLSPDMVAEQLGESSVAELFRSDDVLSINESITDGEYRITLHGIADGKMLAYIDDAEVEEDRSYVVLSVECIDGTELSIIDNNIQFTPLVKGYTPHMVNVGTLKSSLSRFEQDGIIYCLLSTDNLKIFADSTVYIAAFDGTMFTDAFDLTDKNISYASSYDGVQAMFEIPFDPADADSEAVSDLLSAYYG